MANKAGLLTDKAGLFGNKGALLPEKGWLFTSGVAAVTEGLWNIRAMKE